MINDNMYFVQVIKVIFYNLLKLLFYSAHLIKSQKAQMNSLKSIFIHMVYTTPLPSQTHPDNPVTAIFSKNGCILMYLFNIHNIQTKLCFTMKLSTVIIQRQEVKKSFKKIFISEKKVLYIFSL